MVPGTLLAVENNLSLLTGTNFENAFRDPEAAILTLKLHTGSRL
jgi:hypothetical protein